ncbi:hypothetical protein HPB50_014878 [Hyalomma asiaticum]|uniref:Uncharacterized protein n=2 Tax=Hyalomma asiaticum TaxID=266040 RepID=A0ACB7SJD1_HYAAI|nr:hypothetical protein HPB50_009375 [Hyalomma asiaticum]KAH6933446.1 hypothetical protein HPB50_014878 [Hyalomma asiaticum]
MRALLYYGGIYLDGDVFVVQSLRRFLRYEATVSCQEHGSFGNMIMIFHKNSRFLRLYMDTYRQFNDSIWYFNGGHLPTRVLVEPHPHLGHRMYHGLESETDMLGMVYGPHAYPHWRNIFAVHTLYGFRGEVPTDPLYKVTLNESNIRDYDTPLGQMARSVLFGTSDFVPPHAPILSVAELAARVDRGENITKMKPEHQHPFFQNVLKGEK